MSEAIRAAKTELRAALRERRRALDPADVARWSTALCEAVLLCAPWQRARAVAAFVGVKNEPQTMLLLRAARHQGKRLLLPRVRKGGEPALDFIEVDDPDTELVPGSYGLREPAGAAVHDVAAADLVLVPGLAYTRAGDRIGLGPGYYDRALAAVAAEGSPLRMGLCFAAFLDPPEGPIPTEPTDIAMHAIATELGIHLVRKNS
jgi:5-formyltetrahydrofolate cyclo-ligase